MANQTILRISREVTQIQQGSDLSIAVACQESDVRHVKALIIGPPETPYEYGFFEFSVKFSTEYPSKPPKVDAKTTNGGRCRFNPNIYAQGKVCLSILGTWNGEKPGEEWSSAQGLESILISIQSLMSNNPYENEPGFENARSASDEKNQCSYREKIRHETLRIAVIQMLEEALGIQPDGTIEPPTPAWDPEADAEVEEELAQMADAEKPRFEPFKDLYKRRLLWYYDTYLQTIDTYAQKNKDGERFEKMPFEGGNNSMDGVFQYTDLRRRLSFIKDIIYAETNKWAEEGMIAKQRELSVAANLQRQFEQLVEHYKIKNMVTLNLELVNGNPFVWQITYFGRPMTHLDGGVLRIRVCLSPRFPDEQPRVRIETPIYHHRVSKDGIVCYFPKKLDEGSMKGHVEAIIDALEDESPPFDPRTIVNPEATKLFWGSAEDKKKYNRMLRGSVQKTDDPSGIGRAPD